MTAAVQVDAKGVVVACPACGQRGRIPFGRLGQSGRCAQCRGPIAAPPVPVELPTAAAFERLIAGAALPVAVDFWASWCGPCRMMAPELEKAARAGAGAYLVAKLDTEAVPEVAARFQIRSIPTLAVFVGGREVGRQAGARPAAALEAFIRQHRRS